MNEVSNKNVSIYVGGNKSNAFQVSSQNEEKITLQSSKNVSFQMGKNDDAESDKISIKKEETRRKARKIISDQFASDNISYDNIRDNEKKIEEYKGVQGKVNSECQAMKESQKALKDSYGITDDSQEQQDLDLIRKVNKAKKNFRSPNLTKEEQERYAFIKAAGEEGLTSYQRKCLGDDATADVLSKDAEEAQKGIRVSSNAIYATKQGILEQHGMADALVAQEELLKASSEELIGMMVSDAMKEIEEKLAEQIEEAKESAEEKEALEKKIEDAKAENQLESKIEPQKGTEAVTEQIVAGASNINKVQQEIDRLIKNSELLEEDLKGLAVDNLL